MVLNRFRTAKVMFIIVDIIGTDGVGVIFYYFIIFLFLGVRSTLMPPQVFSTQV